MKALFFDIDGTLIDNKTGQVPKSTLRAIEEAKAAGHLTFINTGRVECMIDDIKNKFNIDGYICGCGTQIIAGGETIFEKRIVHCRGIAVKQMFKEFNVEGMLEARQGIYFPAKPFVYPEIMDEMYEAMSGVFPVILGEFDKDDYDFDKFFIVSDPRFAKSDLKSFLKDVVTLI